LQIAWQKHKAASSSKSQRTPFWQISEAKLVLDVWNAVKRGGFDMKVRVTEDAVSRVMTVKELLKLKENVAYPGKSSLLKKNWMRVAKTCGSPQHLQSKAGGSSGVHDKNCFLHGGCRAAPPAGGSASYSESAGIVYTYC